MAFVGESARFRRMKCTRNAFLSLIASLTILAAAPAQKKYDTGVTDNEIRIGNIAAYTGWGKEYGAVAHAEAAYFQMISDRGGIKGRKINFISLDNGSEVAKTLDLAKQLVEKDQVLLIF